MKLIKKENLKVNKKELIIGAVIIIAIIAIAAAYGLSKKSDSINTGKAKSVSVEQKKENKKTNIGEKKKDVVEKDETKAKSEEKAKDYKDTASEKKTAGGENKGSKSSSNTKSSSSTASTPSHSSNSSSNSTPAPKPKRWVVDQAAWDETVQEPVYDYRPTWWAIMNDGSTKIFYSEAEVYQLAVDGYVGSYGNGQDEQYISGYTTRVIHHDEVGHWE